MSDETSERKVTVDDLLFEVRRARRLGRRRVPIRTRMACPCCSVDGEPFSPGPVLLEVDVDWPAELPGKDVVARGVDRCIEAARAAGIEVVSADQR